jgi:hypothetical protein
MNKHFSALLSLSLLSIAACSVAPDDTTASETESSDLSATSALVHGTIAVDITGAQTPGASFADPYAWDDNDLVVPASISPKSPAHAWDIEVTQELHLAVMSESIKLFANGKPDLKYIAMRDLEPKDYPVPDFDTVMALYERTGGSWKQIGYSDDGISQSKGSYIERHLHPGTYRAVVRAKHATQSANIGLFVTTTDQSDP